MNALYSGSLESAIIQEDIVTVLLFMSKRQYFFCIKFNLYIRERPKICCCCFIFEQWFKFHVKFGSFGQPSMVMRYFLMKGVLLKDNP